MLAASLDISCPRTRALTPGHRRPPSRADIANGAVREADVVLLIDVDVPWIPRHVTPADGTRIAQLDIDPLKESIALWGFPVDLPVQADSSKALPELLAAVERRGSAAERARWTARRTRHADAPAAQQQARAATLAE